MKILAIGAHLDDIEIGCGGTLHKAIKKSHKVEVIVMTNSKTTEKNVRLKEAHNSWKCLKIENVNVFSFKDKHVAYDGNTVKKINEVVDSFNPDLILTHWVFDTHQDHRNVALATISACRYKNNILMYDPFPPSGRSYVAFRPQMYVDITNSIKVKIKAIKKYKTQCKKYGENWLKAIKGRAKLRGFESNCNFAEAFEAVRMELKL